MKRDIFQQLNNWKGSRNRKPLILMGARQVGKTTALKKFGQACYKNVVYLNFEDNPSLASLFAGNLKPKQIIQAIEIETDSTIEAGQTLIIFDEIQECPNALNSLKYFNESANDYHIAAAGSLLGVKLSHKKGFPVGKVNFLSMFPMSFNEYLEAINESKLNQFLLSLDSIKPLPGTIHEKCINHFKEYLYTSGMPEAVNEYANNKSFAETRAIQESILKAYQLDFAKHAPTDQIMRINQVWNSIPAQLAKENKKFIYSAIRKGSRAKDFEMAIQWLYEAGLIHKVFNLSTAKLPLKAQSKFDFFKLYLLDVGLLGAMTSLSAKTLIHGNEVFKEFNGSLIENYAAQELARNNLALYYWTSEGQAELDFVIQIEDTIIPIEVKSGNSRKKKSLQVYMEKYQPRIAVRASPMNLKQDAKILNCPLYLLSQLPRLITTATH